MKVHHLLYKTIVIASWFCIPLIVSAQIQDLSLKHGIYVLRGVDCKEPPFAALKSWDGVGFAGPHSGQCTTNVLSHRGNHFDVSTTCAALGDGTPNRSGYVEKLSLTRISSTNFLIVNANNTTSHYRWCTAK